MRFGLSAKEVHSGVRGAAKMVAIISIVIYAIIYLTQPFSNALNTALVNLFLVLSSSFGAAIATMIWASYDRSDAPRRVWANFAIGLWLWAVAELVWGYLNVVQGEVPEGPADFFWIISYVFLGQALFFQYQIVARPTKRELWSRILIAMLFLVVLYLAVFIILAIAARTTSIMDVIINAFYPAADFLLASVALWLASHFAGGALSRPWLGLLAFTFADLMYALIEISGIYSWTVNQANLLTTITDVAYLGAYLILGLGILSHWVFLRYGLRSPTEVR